MRVMFAKLGVPIPILGVIHYVSDWMCLCWAVQLHCFPLPHLSSGGVVVKVTPPSTPPLSKLISCQHSQHHSSTFVSQHGICGRALTLTDSSFILSGRGGHLLPADGATKLPENPGWWHHSILSAIFVFLICQRCRWIFLQKINQNVSIYWSKKVQTKQLASIIIP